MNNKPYKDYICPRCKHNVGFRQQYCGLCGLALDWSGEENNSITYKPYPIIPTGNTTVAPINIRPQAIITC